MFDWKSLISVVSGLITIGGFIYKVISVMTSKNDRRLPDNNCDR